MITILKDEFLDELARAAYQVSIMKLDFTDSYDAPIYPESLVHAGKGVRAV